MGALASKADTRILRVVKMTPPGERDGGGAVAGAPVDPDLATRTSNRTVDGTGSTPPAPDGVRLPAPLQHRDPARYDILGEHGRGGIGRVFRAHDRELGRDVALKELLDRGVASELRFFREALITARLEYPGIVPVHEAGRWPDGTPFYAMKLVAGRPLKALLDACVTTADRIALLPNLIAVADAIAYAHDRRIVHRDLKPSNVIVGEFGETVVIDWGLAKDISASAPAEPVDDGPYRTAAHEPGMTAVGSVLGTAAYMAPEQARGEPVDERADVYAIGAMLYQLCTGVAPAPASAREVRAALRRHGADGDLIAIIASSCDPETGRRYPNAGKLAADLTAIASGARVLARSYSLPALIAHWIRRHQRLAFAIVVLAVAFATVVTIGFLRVQSERDRAQAALAASRVAQAREAEARRAAERERDTARAAQVRELLERDPTRALPIARELPATPDNAVLLARALARPVATHIVTGAPSAFQDAVLHPDQQRVALRTGDNRILELDLETGTLKLLDRDVMEPTPLVPRGASWTYLKRDRGGVAIVRDGALVPWTGPLPITALVSAGGDDYAIAAGDLYRLDGGAPVKLRAGVTAATAVGDRVLACTADGALVRVGANAITAAGTCAHYGGRYDFASSGEAAAVQGRGGEIRRLIGDREATLDREANAIAVGDTGTLAGVTSDGETWYAAAGATTSMRGPAPFAEPTSVAAGDRFAAWGFRDGSAEVLDTHSGRTWQLIARPEPTRWILLTARHAVTVSSSEARVWPLDGARPARLVELPCLPAHYTRSPDGAFAGYECHRGAVGVVAAATGVPIELHRHGARAWGIAWRGDTLCSGGWDGRVLCTDATTRATRAVAELPAPIRWIDADEHRLAFSCEDGAVWLDDDRRSGGAAVVARHAASATRLALGQDGVVASGAVDGDVRITTVRGDRNDHRGLALADRAALIRALDGRLFVVDRAGTVRITTDGADVVDHVAPGGGTLTWLEPLGADAWVATVDGRALWIRDAGGDTVVRFGAAIKAVTRSPSRALVAFAAGDDVFVLDVARRTLAAIDVDQLAVVALAFADDRTLDIVDEAGVVFRSSTGDSPVRLAR
jgi:hypothetical protein